MSRSSNRPRRFKRGRLPWQFAESDLPRRSQGCEAKQSKGTPSRPQCKPVRQARSITEIADNAREDVELWQAATRPVAAAIVQAQSTGFISGCPFLSTSGRTRERSTCPHPDDAQGPSTDWAKPPSCTFCPRSAARGKGPQHVGGRNAPAWRSLPYAGPNLDFPGLGLSAGTRAVRGEPPVNRRQVQPLLSCVPWRRPQAQRAPRDSSRQNTRKPKVNVMDDQLKPSAFVLDIQEIRRRARASMADGAVTGGYRGDRASIVRMLNEALATEIVCVLRYKRHYFMSSNVGGIAGHSVTDEFRQHAEEEQKHADRIASRIVQLGGSPDFEPRGLGGRAHSEYEEGSDLKSMLMADLVAERIAIQVYTEMVSFVADTDPTTRRLLEDILANEEEHADDISDLLHRLSGSGC